MKLLETLGALGGVGGISAIVGGVAGWVRRGAIQKASLEETVKEAVEELIGNLRKDCADARREAKEAKAESEKNRQEHEACRRLLADLQSQIDALMNQKAQTPPVVLPRSVPKIPRRGRS